MKLVIYQTSDLHGYVNPTDYINYKEQGILKIASYILEDEKNYDYSLKIDCGDLIQGSPMTHYLSKKGFEKNPITGLMKKVGYDAYVIGNHEFNYGRDYLKKSYQDIEEKIINSNIKGLDFYSKPYRIFDFDGFKIGVIGSTTQFIPNWEQASTIRDLEFLDPVEEYALYEKELIEKTDLIIYAYHGGFEKSIDGLNIPTEELTKENQASELLEKYDSIDILLSGHQHRSFITKLGKTVCSQPINNGGNFTKIVIDLETKSMTYELLEVKDFNIKINPQLEEDFTELNSQIETYLDKVIGRFEEDILIDNLFKARLHGHPFINFLQDVQLDVANADVSAICLFDTAIGFKKEVTIRDVLINYPYPNTLKVLELSGRKIKEAMEISATYFVLDERCEITINEEFLKPKIQNYNYDMYSGLTYEIDLRKPFGNRVVNIKYNGKDFDLDSLYTIVVNNYRATNTAKYPPYKGAKIVKEINMDMSEIIIEYFNKYDKINLRTESEYKVIK